MNTSLERWLLALLLITIIGMGGTSMYQAQVIEQQRHTIRQCMGLEQGVDAKHPRQTETPSFWGNTAVVTLESRRKVGARFPSYFPCLICKSISMPCCDIFSYIFTPLAHTGIHTVPSTKSSDQKWVQK